MDVKKMKNIGTIIVSEKSPNPSEFHFVMTRDEDDFRLKKGMYVVIPSEEGNIIALVQEVYKTNRYFSSPSAVKAYETSGKSLASIFPADAWEYVIAKAKPLGIQTKKGIQRLLHPVSPGENVFVADKKALTDFLGLDMDNGLRIGQLEHHNFDVYLNLTRLLQKHVAILAISGAGKSYTVSVLLEELLSRPAEKGRIATILFDVHGEYKGLGDKSSPFHEQVEVFSGSFIEFATHRITAGHFANFQPDISPVQMRELFRILGQLYEEKVKEGISYTIQDIVATIDTDDRINQRTKEALSGWLFELERTRLFGNKEYPNLEEKIQPGKLLIIDLSEFTSLRQKQMVVTYMLSRLFDLRKSNKIPPVTIVLEESHQFSPESKLNLAISRPIISTIAREGRKFFISLVLISQRPVNLSTTTLSQCNTHIIMRILNPYDLEFIGRTSEGIDRETLNSITTLGVGEAIIVGNAVNHPIFVSIRERKTKSLKTRTLEEAAMQFDT
ncbi:MAG: ATP-binding protein [Candidatus Heimdallarchaeaceae archaeon]